MITEPIIKFTGELKDKANKNQTRGDLTIEFFHLEKNSWETLIPIVRSSRGKINTEIDFRKDEVRANESLKPVYNALSVSHLPMIRLALTVPGSEEMAQVLAFSEIINQFNRRRDTIIEIDFGSLWFIEPYAIKRDTEKSLPELEYWLVALPRPAKENVLYPAIQAALNATKRFSDYVAKTHTVFTRPKDDVYEANDAKIKELLAEIELLKADLEAKIEKLADLSRALEIEKAINAELKANLDAAIKKTELLNADLLKERDKVKELEGSVIHLKETIKTLETEKDDILSREATSANEIYTAIVGEVENTAEKTFGGRFAVSNLSLNLKTHVKNEDDGFKLQLIDSARADYVKDGTISEVQIDIISQEPAAAETPPTPMPKVIGLTETASRNRLTAYGLNMKAIYQASSTQIIGQAFKQIPQAGEDITTGETVTVIFAKNIEDFN